MKHVRPMLLFGGLTLGAILVAAQTTSTPSRNTSHTSSKAAHADNPDRGQQIFRQNCSRCHNAPEGFPPNVSGTIATHMRVRANLSDADFKALLRFLNP